MASDSASDPRPAEPYVTDAARAYLGRMFPQGNPMLDELAATDPEFIERFQNFAFDEVVREGAPKGDEPLDDHTRFLSLLASLLGCQGIDEFRALLPAALNMGITPVEAKEVVYQATAYLGIGRVAPFLAATNAELTARGVQLPLPAQAETEPTFESRVSAGESKQVEFFGEGMVGFAAGGNPEYPQINRWLSANCFGDWYTRKGLSGADRELVTFCYLAAQGGCEPQLTSHARANMRIGNDKALLLKVVSANVPYIGYPRSLNAIRCVEEAAKA